MKDFKDKLVLITGAGSGIGRETALAFAREGARIIATDISEAGLRETQSLIEQKKGYCETHLVDVSNESGMRKLAETVHGQHGAIDILINNAGVGATGRFMESTPATRDKVLNINVKGVMLGCQLFVQPMIKRGSGHVVNLASMAGYFASPDMSVYATSKFAVLGFSEALRGDLKDQGIGVTAICPGIINTNIVAAATAEGGSANWLGDAVDFYQKRNYPPSKVAKAIVKAVRRNKAVQPVTPEAVVMYHIKRLLPGLARRIAAHPLPFTQQH